MRKAALLISGDEEFCATVDLSVLSKDVPTNAYPNPIPPGPGICENSIQYYWVENFVHPKLGEHSAWTELQPSSSFEQSSLERGA